MAKSPDAFRTISEVSAWLETPPHVLRFWESKFPQVKPVKRAGGRRYYRPEDIALLGGIKVLLHEQGMTIRGVQKMLREQGVRHVASLSAQVWTEDGAGEADLDRDLDPDLDVALGSDFDGDLDVDDADEEVEDATNGVIVGPWTGREDLREVTAAQEDVAHLAALDGLPAETTAEDLDAKEGGHHWEALGDAAPDRDAQEQVEPPTLIDAFLAGTLNRLAADGSESRQGADDETGPEREGIAPPRAPGPELPPLPPSEPTLDRALALLHRADPDRLRVRADRIAPLLDRLKALRDGFPRPPA